MKRQNRDATAGFHAFGQRCDEAIQHAELLIHFNSQRHESTRQCFFVIAFIREIFERGANIFGLLQRGENGRFAALDAIGDACRIGLIRIIAQ